MIKIGISSDNHLEFIGRKFNNLIKMEADILCLAGDICACGNKEDFNIFVDYIKYLSPRFKYIIHVAGNHEYYTSGEKTITKWNTMEEIDKRLKSLQNTISNYIYLNCDVAVLTIRGKKYAFIGATLWAHVNHENYQDVEEGMNDYSYIYKWKYGNPVKFTVPDMQKLFKKHVEFLTAAIQKFKSYPCVVITHHKPIEDTKKYDVLTQAYETDITHIIESGNVKYAFHGHTHKHYNKTINGIKYISNPKGYKGQRTLYDDNMTLILK